MNVLSKLLLFFFFKEQLNNGINILFSLVALFDQEEIEHKVKITMLK